MPSKDPAQRKLANDRHYKKHKALVISRNNIRKKRVRVEWEEFKQTLSCIKCGESHSAILDFHHINPSDSDKKVHRLTANGAYKQAREEIKKCVVLCANCHRKEHYNQRKNPTL